MARRRVRVREVSDVFSARLPGGAWETKTVAQVGSSFASERHYWNGRGYETRVERGVVSEYETDGYVPFGAEVVTA